MVLQHATSGTIWHLLTAQLYEHNANHKKKMPYFYFKKIYFVDHHLQIINNVEKAMDSIIT